MRGETAQRIGPLVGIFTEFDLGQYNLQEMECLPLLLYCWAIVFVEGDVTQISNFVDVASPSRFRVIAKSPPRGSLNSCFCYSEWYENCSSSALRTMGARARKCHWTEGIENTKKFYELYHSHDGSFQSGLLMGYQTFNLGRNWWGWSVIQQVLQLLQLRLAMPAWQVQMEIISANYRK